VRNVLDEECDDDEMTENRQTELVDSGVAMEKEENDCKLYSVDELIELLENIGMQIVQRDNTKPIVVGNLINSSTHILLYKIFAGMVGYPNVGKSSTINRLFGRKVVSVSATPGRTRHFQTIILNDNVSCVDKAVSCRHNCR
jgi:ribosome biogenesis GTPase A